MLLRFDTWIMVCSCFSIAICLEYLYELPKNHPVPQFSISTQSPITRAVRKNATLQSQVAQVYALFDKFHAVVEKRHNQSMTRPCNLRASIPWVAKAGKRARYMQVGEVDTSCPSSVLLSEAVQNAELEKIEMRSAFSVVESGLAALYEASREIDATPEANWTLGTFPLANFVRPLGAQTCSLNSLFAYRRQGTWYVRAAMTNFPVDTFVPKARRQVITEFVPEAGNTSLQMPHIRFGTENAFELSTTLLTVRKGRAPPAFGGYPDFWSPTGVFNLAFSAINQNVKQAEDSLTASNIAILALPMVMNLIPVAFLAQVNTRGTLWYIIFTDVFTVLPFMIKGIELLWAGHGTGREVVAFHIGNQTLSQMEIFSAACHARETYRVLGITFLVIAIVVIALGVCLELYAKKIMKSREARGEDGPFGRVIGHIDHGIFCELEEEARMRKYAYEACLREEAIVQELNRHGDVTTDESSSSSLLKRFPFIQSLVGEPRKFRQLQKAGKHQ